jgi:hypothetical protein
MNTTAIVTIVSNNYLHFARTLLQSVAEHHPDAARYCVIVDRDLGPAHALAQEFDTIVLDALALPDGQDFLFQYTVLELNTAVKPWAMQHLLRQGHEQVFYIDPDIRLYQPLSEVQALLGQGADIVFTPHLLAPITDDRHPTELDIRRAGTYNLGFCAVRNTPNTHRYLEWWQSKLHRHCVVEVDKGIFVDQSWMDLVPGMFERVAVLRHPGYNVAYWNLAQRQVSLDGAGPNACQRSAFGVLSLQRSQPADAAQRLQAPKPLHLRKHQRSGTQPIRGIRPSHPVQRRCQLQPPLLQL